jgi:hypothetical protein
LSGDPALKGIAVDIEGAVPALAADAELLKIVFQNLLMNGAQAMQGRGAVQVMIAPVDGICRVTVRDSGPGIPADVRERIFTPFFTTKARGTGLGLPTAKRIVEAHGGSIAVQCQPGAGTTVEVRLPLLAEGTPLRILLRSRKSWTPASNRGARVSATSASSPCCGPAPSITAGAARNGRSCSRNAAIATAPGRSHWPPTTCCDGRMGNIPRRSEKISAPSGCLARQAR